MLRRSTLLAAVLSLLAGCDQLGLESASVTAARVEADGKAVGAACRHGGRAIEDCFTLNKKVDKAAIYAGWREMDDYMRENKIEAKDPDAADSTDDGAAAAATDKPADKVATRPADKGIVKPIARIEKPSDKPAKLADKAAPRPQDKAAADAPPASH